MLGFTYQVELKLADADALEQLWRMDSWCSKWQIVFRVLARSPGSETVRIAFEALRLARDFVAHYGGVPVDNCELEEAIGSDAADEEVYDRLGREFPA